MVNRLLCLSTCALIIPEAIWEWIVYPGIIALLSIANHGTTISEIRLVDRLLVSSIAICHVWIVPDLFPYATLATALYFGIARNHECPQN